MPCDLAFNFYLKNGALCPFIVYKMYVCYMYLYEKCTKYLFYIHTFYAPMTFDNIRLLF